MIMSSLSTSMHSYLGAKGDKQSLSVLLPANIRFKFYNTMDDVVLENKFSAIPIKLPLVGQIKDAYSKVSMITKQIKSSFSYVYCAYALTYWANLLFPRFVTRIMCHNASMQFTLSFSNVPGPLKYFEIDDDFGNKGVISMAYPFVIVAGRLGMCISCISYGDNFTIAITCDEAVCPDPEKIARLMEQQLRNEIESF